MSSNVRLQNLRNFTVQIRHPETDAIIGTGIVVSMDGEIVTCAHVVATALGVHPRAAGAEEVAVHFPQARGGDTRDRRARITACFVGYDDDVVLLKLADGPAPLAPEQIAVLGDAEGSEGNPFRSYGYSPIGTYPAARADGAILGSVEPPVGQNLQTDPVQLRARQIAPGMSGAAVLDTERNLVVGLVAERYIPAGAVQDDIAYAVDTIALTFDPLNLGLRDTPLEKRPAPQPKTDIALAQLAMVTDLGIAWNSAPSVLPEWVGREALLNDIDRDWADSERRVTGLIGFGGEGKSSLARRWLDRLLADPTQPQPDGVFWWGFQERPSVDEFLEAALKYVSAEQIDSRQFPSASARAHFIAAMLDARPFIFVLDALEVVQVQEGDQFGLLKSADLRDFLSYFAGSSHQSFCLITSRVPVLDLEQFVTYTHRDVTRLSLESGRELLRALGVVGDDAALDQVVSRWDAHALTLSLLGTYLADEHGGVVSHVERIPPPTAAEPHYAGVQRVLWSYDALLTEPERLFLMLFSAFQTPADKRMLAAALQSEGDIPDLTAPIAALGEAGLDTLLSRLSAFRIMRHDEWSGRYTSHALIRDHYYDRMADEQKRSVHLHLKDFYLHEAILSRRIREDLEEIIDAPLPPFGWVHMGEFELASDERMPLSEAVRHGCQAGAYDEAYEIYFFGVHEGDWTLVRQLGAFETDLWLLSAFFEEGDFERQPLVSDLSIRARLINQVGFDYQSLGRPSEAIRFFRRSSQIDLETGDLTNEFFALVNQTEALLQVGDLRGAGAAAGELADLARRASDGPDAEALDLKLLELMSLASTAWVAHLRGDGPTAGQAFQRAEALQVEREPQVRHLYSTGGIWHALHLIRTGDLAYAEEVTRDNLALAGRAGLVQNIAACQRILGHIARLRGEFDEAAGWYDAAVDASQQIGLGYEVACNLLGRGQLGLAQRAYRKASDDLVMARDICRDPGYRLLETDVLIALSRIDTAQGRSNEAEAQAKRALRTSEEMGYHWGTVDAAEVLAALQ